MTDQEKEEHRKNSEADVKVMLCKNFKYDDDHADEFFHWLGYWLFTSVLRGYFMGHKRPFSAARDYLHWESVEEGPQRDAAEFLVDLANMRQPGRMTFQEFFRKWAVVARWRP